MADASLYLDTDGALAGEPLFEGEFLAACQIVWAMTPIARSYARIESAEWSYTAEALECMRREDAEVG